MLFSEIVVSLSDISSKIVPVIQNIPRKWNIRAPSDLEDFISITILKPNS